MNREIADATINGIKSIFEHLPEYFQNDTLESLETRFKEQLDNMEMNELGDGAIIFTPRTNQQ